MTIALPRTEPPEQDGMTEVEESAYHADRGSLSVSGAKLLLPPSCPAKFRHEMDYGRAPKKVWDEGHVAHRVLLGKGAEIAVLKPDVHGLKVDGTASDKPTATASWKQAEAEARERGATPIHVDVFDRAMAMGDAVLNHPEAGPLFNRGHAEKAFYTHDPITGVRLRGRIDWQTLLHDPETETDELVAVDYKSSVTANPAELVRKFWQLGYFMQAAWYIDLIIASGLNSDPRFLFVVVEKEPPHVVTVVEYDQEAIDEGRRLNRLAIDTYARCMETGDWPSYSDAVVTLHLPGWALPHPPTVGDALTDAYIYDTDPLED